MLDSVQKCSSTLHSETVVRKRYARKCQDQCDICNVLQSYHQIMQKYLYKHFMSTSSHMYRLYREIFLARHRQKNLHKAKHVIVHSDTSNTLVTRCGYLYLNLIYPIYEMFCLIILFRLRKIMCCTTNIFKYGIVCLLN
jgi:hypothetical protein